MVHPKNIFLSLSLSFCLSLNAQENEFTEQTFFSGHTGIGHSSETTEKGYLNMYLAHRMGRLSSGPKEFFGLNQATSMFALDYGFSNTLTAGLGIGSLDKNAAGYIKYKILRQAEGAKPFPFTLSWLSQAEIKTGPLNYPEGKFYPSSRLSYVHQLIFARKFSEKFSAQLSPVLVHRNMVRTRNDNNSVFLGSVAVRYKIKRKVALTAEYFYLAPNQIFAAANNLKARSAVSAGIEFFTGRHSFQLFISNTVAPNEALFLSETTENPFGNGLHLGFNITRLFLIKNYYE